MAPCSLYREIFLLVLYPLKRFSYTVKVYTTRSIARDYRLGSNEDWKEAIMVADEKRIVLEKEGP